MIMNMEIRIKQLEIIRIHMIWDIERAEDKLQKGSYSIEKELALLSKKGNLYKQLMSMERLLMKLYKEKKDAEKEQKSAATPSVPTDEIILPITKLASSLTDEDQYEEEKTVAYAPSVNHAPNVTRDEEKPQASPFIRHGEEICQAQSESPSLTSHAELACPAEALA